MCVCDTIPIEMHTFTIISLSLSLSLCCSIFQLQTLKRPKLLQAAAGKDISSTRSDSANIEEDPLITISSALAPQKVLLSSLNLKIQPQLLSPTSSTSTGSRWTGLLSDVDTLFTTRESPTLTHDLFKASFWSPAGCNHLGG